MIFCDMIKYHFEIWYIIEKEAIFRKASAKNINSFYGFPYLIDATFIHALFSLIYENYK